jgi:hypothetical protein
LKIVYFDCFSGISGDMCLGAIVGAGVPLDDIRRELKRLPVRGFRLDEKKVRRAGMAATKIDVLVTDDKKRRWADVKGIIQGSGLSPEIKKKGLRIFKNIFEAEAAVHGSSLKSVHLHEMGSLDSVVDIIGTLAGIRMLGVEKIFSSPVNLGGGLISSGHGTLPVPAPATAEILKGTPVYSSGIDFELTTPTGAAILREVASGFGPLPPMVIKRIGSGAGDRDLDEIPNVLRIFIGESGRAEPDIVVIETNIDDMNPQIYEHVIERLFKDGALDAYLTQVIMKKGRPGIKLTVLCHEGKKRKLVETLFRETTTIGVRLRKEERHTLERKIKKIDTKFGEIRVKESRLPDGTLRAMPEYEDCKRIAKKKNISLIEVMRSTGAEAGDGR